MIHSPWTWRHCSSARVKWFERLNDIFLILRFLVLIVFTRSPSTEVVTDMDVVDTKTNTKTQKKTNTNMVDLDMVDMDMVDMDMVDMDMGLF